MHRRHREKWQVMEEAKAVVVVVEQREEEETTEGEAEDVET